MTEHLAAENSEGKTGLSRGLRVAHGIVTGKAREWEKLHYCWPAHEATGHMTAVVTYMRKVLHGLVL